MAGSSGKTEVVEEVFENQRYMPSVGYNSNFLLPTERGQWSDADGEPVAVCPHSPHLSSPRIAVHGWGLVAFQAGQRQVRVRATVCLWPQMDCGRAALVVMQSNGDQQP